MTTEVALLRAVTALRERFTRHADQRDAEAIDNIQRIIDQRGMDEHEPGCDYLTTAIDVWVYG
jgi:hypothetical protein